MVKLVFIHYQADPLIFSATPEEIATMLNSAAEMVNDRCKEHDHANAHCELVHFHPMSTPANYVTKGELVDLVPSNNHTHWFNQLNIKIS